MLAPCVIWVRANPVNGYDTAVCLRAASEDCGVEGPTQRAELDLPSVHARAAHTGLSAPCRRR